MHRGIFIENQEVQSVAAEGIVVVGATQRDRAAGHQLDRQIGFVRLADPIWLGHLLERLPGDAFRLPVRRGHVPRRPARTPRRLA